MPVEGVNVPDPAAERVPPIFNVPASVNVNRACAAVPENVILPETLIVPVETETIQFLLAVPLPGIAILVAFKVPVPTDKVLLTAAVGAFIVIAPQLRILEPLIDIPFAVADALMVIVPTNGVLATSMVTVTPLLIMILSPATGTAAPPQVAVLDQLPETDAVLVAASTFKFTPIVKTTRISTEKMLRLILLR